MNRNGNTYTVLYAAIMVILVAAILATASMALKPLQNRNKEIEKEQNILTSANIPSTTANSAQLFKENITKEYVVNSKGETVEGVDAFNVDLKKEHTKPVDQRNLPVFECQSKDGLKYIFPVRGTGLWGPIWGFVSLDDDMNTIYGAIFDDEGETPGLGAEIATRKFQVQFKGKKLFDDSGKLVSITVTKAGQTAPEEHKVDGISGGTITSKGLQKMLLDDFTSYEKFLIEKKNK
ncbi:MAG TPA: NADH:ubiquinone reductase (Na(+)-transporting) subunit C [Draconibacterium sp.]|nr:NADH:ubiquinone reductase (Na(+)-transporting) subunit C [Draconibacterium sp.]